MVSLEVTLKRYGVEIALLRFLVWWIPILFQCTIQFPKIHDQQLKQCIRYMWRWKSVFVWNQGERLCVWGFFESLPLVSDVDWMMVDVHSRRCGTDVGIHKCLLFARQSWNSIVIHPDSCCIVKLLHTVVENRTWRYTFARDTWKEIMKNNLMSCYKYSHWDPFMDVNPKYHRQANAIFVCIFIVQSSWTL